VLAFAESLGAWGFLVPVLAVRAINCDKWAPGAACPGVGDGTADQALLGLVVLALMLALGMLLFLLLVTPAFLRLSGRPAYTPLVSWLMCVAGTVSSVVVVTGSAAWVAFTTGTAAILAAGMLVHAVESWHAARVSLAALCFWVQWGLAVLLTGVAGYLAAVETSSAGTDMGAPLVGMAVVGGGGSVLVWWAARVVRDEVVAAGPALLAAFGTVELALRIHQQTLGTLLGMHAIRLFERARARHASAPPAFANTYAQIDALAGAPARSARKAA
jgi:hypothetical protein